MPQTDGELVVTGDLTLCFTVKMATGLPTFNHLRSSVHDGGYTPVHWLLPGRNRALSGAVIHQIPYFPHPQGPEDSETN